MIATRINPTDDLTYLLGSVDSAGRNRKSEIVEGGLLPAVLEARKMAGRFKEPSFVYTYREPKPLDKIGGVEFEEKLKEEILETFLPKLDRKQFYYLFIRHHNPDKSYELNFYLVCMANGRQFSPYVDKRDRKAHELMGKMLHQENPLLTNPNAPENTKLLAANPRISESVKVLFNDVSTIAESSVKNGKIRNRVELISVLEGNGFSIFRCGKDYFTVASGDTRVRLSGPAADSNFKIESFKKKCSESLNPTVNYRKLWQAENERHHEILTKKYKHLKKNINYESRKPTNKHEQMDRAAFARNPTEHTNGGQTGIGNNALEHPATTLANRDRNSDRSENSRSLYDGYKTESSSVDRQIDFGNGRSAIYIYQCLQPKYQNSREQNSATGNANFAAKTAGESVGKVIDDFIRLFFPQSSKSIVRLLSDFALEMSKPPTDSLAKSIDEKMQWQKSVVETAKQLSKKTGLQDINSTQIIQQISIRSVTEDIPA